MNAIEPDVLSAAISKSRQTQLLIGMAASGHLILAIRRLNGPLMHEPFGAFPSIVEEIVNYLISGLLVEIPFLILIFVWLASLRFYKNRLNETNRECRRCTIVAILAWAVGIYVGITFFWPGFNGPTGWMLTLMVWWPALACMVIGPILLAGLIAWPLLASLVKFFRQR